MEALGYLAFASLAIAAAALPFDSGVRANCGLSAAAPIINPPASVFRI
jgi:hypothetical protein